MSSIGDVTDVKPVKNVVQIDGGDTDVDSHHYNTEAVDNVPFDAGDNYFVPLPIVVVG